MGAPKDLQEWRRMSPAWREKARRLIPEGGYPGKRLRPRDPDEVRALRKLGVDRQRPFGPANEAADAALQIRVARKRAGLSQAELAERMGVSQQQVQRLEDPERSNPTVATLRAVAAALELDLRIQFVTIEGRNG